MLLLKNDGRRREKLGICRQGSDTAVPLQARAVPSFWCSVVLARLGMARPCQASGISSSNFFFSVFLNRSRTITYKIT